MSILPKSLVVIFCLYVVFGCEPKEQKQERLARQYCGSCHVFPEPGLLGKSTWDKTVFPEMAFRMGLSRDKLYKGMYSDEVPPNGVIPEHPMVTPEEWELIRNYFLTNAPDSLAASAPVNATMLTQFEAFTVRINSNLPLITLIQADTNEHKIFVGTRAGKLFKLDEKFVAEDSFMLPSPPSHLIFQEHKSPVISLLGIMDPNDEIKGKIGTINEKHRFQSEIDSLKRPVFFEQADLNGDHLNDYVICAFGNYAGALLLMENLGNRKFGRHELMSLPGARKVVVKDVDNDGKKDILCLFAQGSEQLILFRNKDNFNFTQEVLLRFPPVYGSSYFDVADFNHDGRFDILYTNGDNSDYSPVLKPYHGVRVFLNDGKDKFEASWFQPMNGASWAVARDFDLDGDLDIAAISFFPDFTHHPDEGFLYLENTGKGFLPYTTPLARSGRWLVMEAADIDRDGDCDIILGALTFRTKPAALFEEWSRNKVSLLVLRNKGR